VPFLYRDSLEMLQGVAYTLSGSTNEEQEEEESA